MDDAVEKLEKLEEKKKRKKTEQKKAKQIEQEQQELITAILNNLIISNLDTINFSAFFFNLIIK